MDSNVSEDYFYGKKFNHIRVTYKPEVGEDIWRFYFSTETHALEAYQFFHVYRKMMVSIF